jgi:hypothetical protein
VRITGKPVSKITGKSGKSRYTDSKGKVMPEQRWNTDEIFQYWKWMPGRLYP